MRRAIVIIMALFLVGCAINIAIALWCAVNIPMAGNDVERARAARLSDGEMWSVDVYTTFASTRVDSVRRSYKRLIPKKIDAVEDHVPRWTGLYSPSSEFETSRREMRIVDGRGWPFRAIKYELRWTASDNVHEYVGGIPLEQETDLPLAQGLRAVPYHIIPLGFAANATLYSLVLWVPFAGLVGRARQLRIATQRARLMAMSVAVYGLLGVVVTVLVAWGSAVFVAVDETQDNIWIPHVQGADVQLDRMVEVWRTRVAPQERTRMSRPLLDHPVSRQTQSHSCLDTTVLQTAPASSRATRRGWPQSGQTVTSSPPTTGLTWPPAMTTTMARDIAIHFRAGWPMKSMQGGHLLGVDVQNKPVRRMSIDSIEVDSDALPDTGYGTGRDIPLRPIWPGFIVNSLASAMILWIILGVHPYVRIALRMHRRACLYCGYIMRGNAGKACSECGRDAV